MTFPRPPPVEGFSDSLAFSVPPLWYTEKNDERRTRAWNPWRPFWNCSPPGPAGPPALAAIDGRCGSGKSTLAGLAAHRLGCPLFHMDDFFLPPALRTPERYAAPGGNVHYERVEAELLRPLRETGAACFRPFDCRSMDFSAPIRAELTGLALVEAAAPSTPPCVAGMTAPSS